MAQAIDNFQKQKLQIRKDLRETRSGLDKDIRALGWKLKLINILLMPAVVVVVGLLVFSWRKRRRHAIAMLRKGSAA